MYVDLLKIKKVFFVGIGGIGISAIARMMLVQGKSVVGSDISGSMIIEDLKKLGAEIQLGQGIELIPKDVDLIVYSTAVRNYDKEFFKNLQKLNIQMASYPEMLGVVTDGKYTIAISGTHGKTTTTAMVAKILIDAAHDPSVIVGSLLKGYNSNLVIGKKNFFVVEACEYERAFLNIKPKILIITNIEEDHLDYYKDLKDIQSAFKELILQTEDLVVFNGAESSSSIPISEYMNKKRECGFADYTKYLDKVPKLLVPGEYNRMNAAAALAVADILNIDLGVAQKSLSEFSGTWRRLEKKGETAEGTIIYDDYAHHPTEIKASLQGLRELYPNKKITIIFQPHLYSRTKALFEDFTKSFTMADRVLFLPIFFAREAPDPTVSSEKLSKAVGGTALAFPDFSSAENFVKTLNLGKDDVFVTMGAGEAYKVADVVFPENTLIK